LSTAGYDVNAVLQNGLDNIARLDAWLMRTLGLKPSGPDVQLMTVGRRFGRASAAAAAEGISAEGRAATRFLSGVTVESGGQVIGRGIVDLGPTLKGIESGNIAPRDIFRNDQGLLPRQPTGYYQEFVQPTPGVGGAGPQRIIQGQGGELYYTPNHYRTFVPLN